MKIFQKLRSLSSKSKLGLVVLALGVAIAVPAVHAEFYPGDRPTFDYNKSGNGNCDDPNNPALDHGRCGSMNGPVFNSFINTPSYGDERPFFDGRIASAAKTTNDDPVSNVTANGSEVILRVYVHNNANQDTDCLPAHLTNNGCSQIDNSAPGIAHGAKVRILLPTDASNVLRARAYISADNASTVEDTVDMTSAQNFNVSYVPGSAKLLRDNASYQLNDSIVGGGALIGNTVMDGNLPGCFDFAGLVEIHVKITPKVQPQLDMTKQVRMKGSAAWVKSVDAKPGDTVQWLISTKDNSNANLNNVIVRDVLPPHVQLVPGTIHLIRTGADTVMSDGPLFSGGINEGTYLPAATEYVMFDTKVLGDFGNNTDQCSTRVRNFAHAKSDQTPNELTDTSDVVITKENCQPTNPTFSCDMLNVTLGANRTANFTTQASASGGATITMYSYDFGDGTPVLNTDKASVSHAYAKDGNYAAHVTVQFNSNGKVQTATSTKCATAVNFTTPGTPTTPGNPTTLVNTGPGATIASLFAATTAIGAIAYRWMLGRRLG